jgi:hypothetical protein
VKKRVFSSLLIIIVEILLVKMKGWPFPGNLKTFSPAAAEKKEVRGL